jgi:Zn-dependent peptidase ImmA (M78 family)
LHGCLVAFKGKGAVIVDGSDSGPEIRFTIAHEISHFLLDYVAPRQRAIERLGPSLVDVVDALRQPTAEEHTHAILSGVSLAFYAHFMHRDEFRGGSLITLESEDQADRLAFELLAPEEEVWRSLPKSLRTRPFAAKLGTVRRILVRRFGLPAEASTRYAATFCRSHFGGVSVREWLGVK